MRAEIITSGTELLLGEIIDTNTPFLAQKLAQIGINVYHHTTVGDNATRLLETIIHAESRAEIIIISGGLGPTQDDITKNVLAKHLNVKLKLDDESLRKVKHRYQTSKLSSGNYRQALILEDSIPLKNDTGMAAGIFIEKNDKKYILLPGPPNEFEKIVDKYLLPKLSKIVNKENVLRSRNLNFYGLGESVIAERLDALIKEQSNPSIAIYAKQGIIDVRITANCSSEARCNHLLDRVEENILEILHPYFIGKHQQSLETIISNELESQDKTISLLEVQTEGDIIAQWTKEPSMTKRMKGGLYCPSLIEAANQFHIPIQSNEEDPTEEIACIKNTNEQLAKIIQEELKADIGVAVTNYKVCKENLHFIFVSFSEKNNKVITKTINLSNQVYFAPWIIQLKVNDFIRRILLKLPQIE